MLIIKRLNTFKFHVQHVNFSTNSEKVAYMYFAKQTSYVQNKNRDDDTCAPGININRVAQNKNLTYFAVGFSVISLMISELMLEICLKSMRQTEFWLKCCITGGRWKVSPIVSPKLKNSSDHVTQHVEIQNLTPQAGHNGWQNEIIRLQKSENNSLPWNLRNSIISPLWEMGMFNFLVKYAVRMFFLAFVICINIRFFFCVQLDPLFHILCVQTENECVPGRNDALWIHLCLFSGSFHWMKSDQNESTVCLYYSSWWHSWKHIYFNLTRPMDDLWSYYTRLDSFLVIWDDRTTANVDPC